MARKYTTKTGDMWDKIAKEQLGNEFYANQLIDANLKYGSIVKFDNGILLTIPDMIITKSKINLPPWAR